jgi:hypothetical protein
VEVLLSPNAHDQELGEPVEVSVKFTANGAVPLVGLPVKFATGGATVTVM